MPRGRIPVSHRLKVFSQGLQDHDCVAVNWFDRWALGFPHRRCHLAGVAVRL
jgi:hypothetical protein